jgi:hypothetical protein
VRTIRHAEDDSGEAFVVVLLFISLLSSGAAWAKPPSRCKFDPGFVGQRVTPASGLDLSLASSPEFGTQPGLSDTAIMRTSEWPDNAHGWGKAAIYGLEFAGAAIPIYGSFGLTALLMPKGETVLDPDAGFMAFVLCTAGELTSPCLTMEVGRLLHQQGDAPDMCIDQCVALPLLALGAMAASGLKGATAVIVAVPLALLQPALTVVGYNTRRAPAKPKTAAQQSLHECGTEEAQYRLRVAVSLRSRGTRNDGCGADGRTGKGRANAGRSPLNAPDSC